ncbi:TPA: hypothetical protein SHW33_003710 [Clostridioides difficile]|uniref:hypothetical protein n=1 Tax=Clostridioides difficile TaxID=1496 RepID=UPI0004180F48|nr:hypothetical protein [Clostridioides difficile]EGT4018522.1 hypothetical protein [Clostridioides difficile]EGT4186484.1 hypothetical protein [Clostridioides difficile]EGT5475265.1 hypothetical protein [Clostridioides difficile]EJA6850669.1 hypothetical protein [Clostridioides difficile]ELX4591763.1 hypothetical protein [Clostridioides difficile]
MHKKSFKRRGTFDFYFNEYGDWNLFEFSANPCLEYEKIDFSSYTHLKSFGVKLNSLLNKALNAGKYIYIGVDRYYIPHYHEYLREHTSHHIFINGYDNISKIYYAHDNFKNGKYRREIITYKQLEDSFESIVGNGQLEEEAYLGGVAFLKPKAWSWHCRDVYKINLMIICESIKEYLQVEPYNYKYKKVEGYVFGVDCYEELEKLLTCTILNQNIDIDYRAFCCMRDHKRIMIFRLNEIQKEFKKDFAKFINEFEVITEKLNIVINLSIKMNIAKSLKTTIKMIEYLKFIKYKEIELLKSLLEYIERSLNVYSSN